MRPILFILLLFLSLKSFAQYPDFHHESKEIMDRADRLTDIYDAQLGLDGLQIADFYDVVKDHLGAAKSIKQEFKGSKQTFELKKLKNHEIGEMSNILTRIQFNYYLQIRPEIQPDYYLSNQEY